MIKHRGSKKPTVKMLTAAGTLLAFLFLSACGSFPVSFSVPVYAREDALSTGDDPSTAVEGEYTRELEKRSVTTDPEDAVLIIPEDLSVQEEKTHTVMIYMIGSNLESRLGHATEDMEEMKEAGLSYEDVNILIYTGGSRRWIGEVPNDRNCVLDLSKGVSLGIMAQTASNADMGAPETLSNFVNFCTDYYPAEHYSLILWDHGGGPLWGYGSDELFDADSLLLEEQKAAMEETIFAGEANLDFVGFDACLMGSIESMSIWKDYADFYIGSEELEPGDGWDYTFLKVFEQTKDPKETTKAVTDSYGEFYTAVRTANFNPDVTLSCVDLSKTEKIAAALNDMAACMIGDYKKGSYSEIMQKRAQTKGFALSENSKGYVSFYYDLVDMGDLAKQFSPAYPEQAAALGDSLQEAVVCSSTNVERACGVSLYFPYRNKAQFSEMRSAYKNVAISDNYTKFLDLGTASWMKSKFRDWELGEMTEEENEYTLTLTSEQRSNSTGAFYTVSAVSSSGGYIPYMTGCRLKADRKGVLHIPKNPEVAVLRSSVGETIAVSLTEVESDAERTIYRTENTILKSDLTYPNHYGDLETMEISLLLSRDKETKEVSVLSVNDDSPDKEFGSKTTIDFSVWEGIAAGGRTVTTTRNESGVILPFNEWNGTGEIVTTDLAIDGEVNVEIVPCTEIGLHFVCQVGIEDVNGEYYASELSSLPANHEVREETLDTEKGTLFFKVYEDHAEVADYSGTDIQLIVPESVDGIPVTEIGDYAFGKLDLYDAYGTYRFESVTLPDTVVKLGAGAFYSCAKLKNVRLSENLETIGSMAFGFCDSLKTIELPESLRSVGKCAFAYCGSLNALYLPADLEYFGTGALTGCKSLESISVPDENENFAVYNGSLYTKDQKTMLAHPAAIDTMLEVISGTETIAYGACSSCAVSNVSLPDSLKKIGNYAFYACDSLMAPAFPDGVNEIGMHSFDTNTWAVSEESVSTMQRITIGPEVLKIGEGAFDGFLYKAFIVNPENTRFSSGENTLLNGAGDSVVSTSINKRHQVVLPEGVTEFDFEILDFITNINVYSSNLIIHLYLPESVSRFPENVSVSEKRNLRIHAPKGSMAEAFAMQNGISVSNEMANSYKEIEKQTPGGVLTARIYSDYAMITRYMGKDDVLTLPNRIGGKPVKVIGDGEKAICVNGYHDGAMVSDAPNLTKIIVPEGAEELNKKALDSLNAINPVSVELPSTLKSIEESALTDCIDFVLPKGLERLGRNFTNVRSLEEFEITSSVRYIDPEAFASILAFKTFTQNEINENYTVQDGILYNAGQDMLILYPTAAAESFTVPDGCESIAERAFSGCRTLRSITFPESIKRIEKEAFSGCTSLETIVFLEPSMEKIASYAFANCTQIRKIALPGVEEIADHAFYRCTSLREVTFTEGLLAIRESAFSETAVYDPKLPKSITTVEDYAFYDFSENKKESAPESFEIGEHLSGIGLLSFAGIEAGAYKTDEENTNYSSLNGFLTDKAGNMIYACPSGMTGEVFVPEGTTLIAEYAFYNKNTISKLHIPASVEFIGNTNFRRVMDEGSVLGSQYHYTVTICCKRNSFAHRYAMEMGIPFVLE